MLGWTSLCVLINSLTVTMNKKGGDDVEVLSFKIVYLKR